ncbi:MAG: sulfatase [Planctomycetaceae bacterium]
MSRTTTRLTSRTRLSTRLLFPSLMLLVASCCAAAESNLRNVLFIAIDDLRPELGCYGVSAAQSPHLDRFAGESVVFGRHYVQVATCGASRFALLTGRSPVSSGVRGGNEALYSGTTSLSAELQPGAQSLPELFRRSGYRTICLGKVSHTADGRVFAYNGQGDGRDELPHAWDELPTPFGPWQRGWGIFFAYANGKHREDGQGHQDLMEFVAEADTDLPDGLLAEEGVRQLRDLAARDQPFFLGVGFFKPHLPWVATRGDWDAFAETDIAIADEQERPESPFWHKSGEFYKYDMPFEKSRPISTSAQRECRRAYLACVRYTDRQVGKLLAELDALGLREETAVVIWGDHGWHLGDDQLWGKHSPFERANRSVLMFRVPGVTRPGVHTNALAETIDLYPTLIDLCQPAFRETRFPLDGRSLLPVLTGEQDDVRQTAISYWGDATSVRDATHRLILKGRGDQTKPLELYSIDDQQRSTPVPLTAAPEIVQRLTAAARSSRDGVHGVND